MIPELLAVDGDCAYGVCIKSSPDQERDSQDAASFTTESHVYEPREGRQGIRHRDENEKFQIR